MTVPTEGSERSDLEILEQIEQVLFDLRTHDVALDASFRAPPAGTSADAADVAAAQAAERQHRMAPRLQAVASLRQQLRQLVEAEGRRMLHRYPREASSWRCLVHGTVPLNGMALRDVCEWGCEACCDAAMHEVQAIRDRLPPPAAQPPVWRDPQVFTRKGRLRVPVAQFLSALPRPGEQALPRSLDTIASAAGMNPETVRKLSQPLQDAGFIVADASGVWRRLRDADNDSESPGGRV